MYWMGRRCTPDKACIISGIEAWLNSWPYGRSYKEPPNARLSELPHAYPPLLLAYRPQVLGPRGVEGLEELGLG